MRSAQTRRSFLSTSLALPIAALASSQPTKAAQLSFARLGKTGLKVTRVGFGCMVTSDPSVVERALDIGINYFDTARRYQSGNNERMVGAVIKGRREKIILSTKSGGRTPEAAFADLETSLKTLATDYVDVWYMHAVDDPKDVTDELVSAWEKAKQQGKIRHIGISTHQPNALVDRILQVGKFEVVLVVHNFMIGSANDQALDRLHKAGLGLVAMKVMAPASRQFGFKADRPERLQRPGAPLAALKWVLRDSRFATTIPSMVDMDQLEVNLRAMSESFSPEDEKLLARLSHEIRSDYCRMCYRCTGQCPNNLPVPDILRYLAYADFYGQFALAREHFLSLPERVQKVNCQDCRQCTVRCPNGVDVQRRLIKAQQFFA